MDRARSDGPVVQGFAAQGFRVDGGIYPALLLTPERADAWVDPSWDEAALASLLALHPPPEFLLAGTGPALTRPPAALARALAERGIGLEAMDSRAAARAWGMLRSEGRWIAAALMPF